MTEEIVDDHQQGASNPEGFQCYRCGRLVAPEWVRRQPRILGSHVLVNVCPDCAERWPRVPLAVWSLLAVIIICTLPAAMIALMALLAWVGVIR